MDRYNYGDEDQNDLMYLIESYRETDDDNDNDTDQVAGKSPNNKAVLDEICREPDDDTNQIPVKAPKPAKGLAIQILLKDQPINSNSDDEDLPFY